MKTTIVTMALKNSSWSLQITGTLRNDDSNGSDNATNQIFDWLNEENNCICSTCDTPFGAIN